MGVYNDIKTSVLWKNAAKELESLPLEDKFRLYVKVFRPQWVGRELDIHDKFDVLFKIPNIFRELDDILTHRQLEVLKMMSYGCTHQEICDEFGYANSSSVSAVINSIKARLKQVVGDIRTEEEIEEDLIELIDRSGYADSTTE